MSLRKEIIEILKESKGLNPESLENAQPAILPGGRIVGGLVFVATKDDKNDSPAYEKGEHFTLLQITSNVDGEKVVHMSRNADASVHTFPASSPFKLYGSELKSKRNKKANKKQ